MPLTNCMSGVMYGSYESLLTNVLSVTSPDVYPDFFKNARLYSTGM